jgi:hypothetical protein
MALDHPRNKNGSGSDSLDGDGQERSPLDKGCDFEYSWTLPDNAPAIWPTHLDNDDSAMKTLALALALLLSIALDTGIARCDEQDYTTYKVKPFDKDELAHYIQIPTTWVIEKVTVKSAELSATPKPLDFFHHTGTEENRVSEVHVLVAQLDNRVTPLKYLQFYLNQLAKTQKVHIRSITTIDPYRAKSSMEWEIQSLPFQAEVFLNLSKDQERVFIVQCLSNEQDQASWEQACDYTFRSFSIIN